MRISVPGFRDVKVPSIRCTAHNTKDGSIQMCNKHSADIIDKLTSFLFPVQSTNRSFSTEDLNTEMLNLEGLMKDLNAITASELQS